MLGPHIMVLHVAKQGSSLKAMNERKEKRKGVESFSPLKSALQVRSVLRPPTRPHLLNVTTTTQ